MREIIISQQVSPLVLQTLCVLFVLVIAPALVAFRGLCCVNNGIPGCWRFPSRCSAACCCQRDSCPQNFSRIWRALFLAYKIYAYMIRYYICNKICHNTVVPRGRKKAGVTTSRYVQVGVFWTDCSRHWQIHQIPMFFLDDGQAAKVSFVFLVDDFRHAPLNGCFASNDRGWLWHVLHNYPVDYRVLHGGGWVCEHVAVLSLGLWTYFRLRSSFRSTDTFQCAWLRFSVAELQHAIETRNDLNTCQQIETKQQSIFANGVLLYKYCSKILLYIAKVLGGRSSTSTLVKSRDKENIVYETQVSVHPFFDSRQGRFACKSAMVFLWFSFQCRSIVVYELHESVQLHAANASALEDKIQHSETRLQFCCWNTCPCSFWLKMHENAMSLRSTERDMGIEMRYDALVFLWRLWRVLTGQIVRRSGLLVALPIVMLLSAVMSWWSFKAYPSNLFGDGDEDTMELLEREDAIFISFPFSIDNLPGVQFSIDVFSMFCSTWLFPLLQLF